MPGPITSADLVAQVRAQVDEQNTDTLTDQQIYDGLNRAQRKAANRLVKQYADLFMTFATFTSNSANGDTYPIPTQSFGRRINSMTIVRNFIEYPVKRVRAYDLHKFSSSILVRLPSVYALIGRNMIIRPTPMSGVLFKAWFPAAPETIVKPLGRIVSVDTTNQAVVLDAVDSSLTTDVTSLAGYVNVVDAASGYIKATMQVASVGTGNLVSFKTAGLSAATIYTRTVLTALPTGNVQPVQNVNEQDYLCPVQGTCVPDLPDACLDFLVQYNVNDVKRRLGEPIADEKALLDELEADIQSQWAGRECSNRIMNRARFWTR